ncbi:MAG: class I SAM-dependent methyltransferase [Rhabdochlamydiaceae bacterium]|nr:class I SAM-dependent methyltransferase [Rhabdochlamydiaceae bacterium]
MKKTLIQCTFFALFSLFPWIASAETNPEEAKILLKNQYDLHCNLPSDINEHLPTLRRIASECQSVVEIGVRSVVSSWGLIQGLSENPNLPHTYLGVDIGYPPAHIFKLVKELTEANNISFDFWAENDMNIEIESTDLLFLDTLHIYAQLTYELETFSPKARKYIIMHDTSQTFEYRDCLSYTGDYSEYPSFIDRNKHGLWVAVQDFLARHPEWVLHERYANNNGLSVLKRVSN